MKKNNVIDFTIELEPIPDDEIIERLKFILTSNKIPAFKTAIKNMIVSYDFYIKTGKEPKITF